MEYPLSSQRQIMGTEIKISIGLEENRSVICVIFFLADVNTQILPPTQPL